MKKKIYLNNKELYKEIIVSKAMGKLTPEAEKMFILLGKNLIKKFHYKDPDDRLDCYQTAMLSVFRNWHNFDEVKSNNAFAYFSEIFKRGAAAGFGQIHKRIDGVWIEHMSLDYQDADGNAITRI